MSPIATKSFLIAGGCGNPRVMLCDLGSGGFAHALQGLAKFFRTDYFRTQRCSVGC